MINLTKQVVIIAIAMSAIVGCKKGAEGNFDANPDTFVGLGVRGPRLLSPFYVASPEYVVSCLIPRITSNTKGAVLISNITEWTSGWLQFLPQTSVD